MITILLEELVMKLFLWILQLIDGILVVFESISGITEVTTSDGLSTNLIETSINNSVINTWFWSILLLSVGLLCIFTVAAVIKNIITNQKTNAQIIGKFALALIGTIAVLAVVILAVLITNELLQLVWQIVGDSGDGNVDLVNTLFNACVGEWNDTYSITQLKNGVEKVYELSVADILGNYNTSMWVFPTEWLNDGMINPDKFYYVPALIAMFGTGWMMCKVVLQMAKRVYEIVMLYIVMPVSMSTLPLDDGARFKNWTEMFISKIIGVFGAVLAIRLYMIILQIVCGLTVSTNNFVQCLFLIFMTVAGAFMLPTGVNMFAQLFGGGNNTDTGGGMMGHTILSAVSMVGHTAIHVAGAGVNAAKGAIVGGAKLGYKAIGHRPNYSARKQEKAERKAQNAEKYGTGIIGLRNRRIEHKNIKSTDTTAGSDDDGIDPALGWDDD